MALNQMQIIQSLGEAMSWFERELNWGVSSRELTHLTGRIGELYTALIMNGQMATEVNQHGYDVVSAIGEYISVKTTTMLGNSGHISFNPNTLEKVDRVVILRINTEEMQIETLFNDSVEKAVELMGKPNSNGKLSISLSKLTTKIRMKNILVIKEVVIDSYTIKELETGSIEVSLNNELISPVQPILRKLAVKHNITILNSNGNPYNTRQLGRILIEFAQ